MDLNPDFNTEHLSQVDFLPRMFRVYSKSEMGDVYRDDVCQIREEGGKGKLNAEAMTRIKGYRETRDSIMKLTTLLGSGSTTMQWPGAYEIDLKQLPSSERNDPSHKIVRRSDFNFQMHDTGIYASRFEFAIVEQRQSMILNMVYSWLNEWDSALGKFDDP